MIKNVLIKTLFVFCISELVNSDTIGPRHCAMYDECGPNPNVPNSEIRGSVPCKNNVPAVEYEKNTPFYGFLQNLCPELVPEGSESAFACCSWTQLNTLSVSLTATALLFSRCPSCMANIYTIFCQNTCSPNQSMFINVSKSMENGMEHPIVLEYQAYLDKGFADASFDSCSNVIFPSTNGRAVELMCSGKSGDECTTQPWLDFFGTTDNGLSPVDIKFMLFDNTTTPAAPPEPYEPTNPKSFSCTESPVEGEPSCSCTDCKAACPSAPPTKPPKEPFKIGNTDGVLVIVIIVFCSVVVAFFTFILICYVRRRNKPQEIDFKKAELDDVYATIDDDLAEHKTVRPEDISCFEKWGKKSEDFFTNMFQKWGMFVARHPIPIIVIAVIVVCALTAGIVLVEITTDPIQLWSSEGSKVRNEKDFFDEHFGAFYRTEQVILKLKPELEKTHSYTSYLQKEYNFSAILEQKRLLEVLELQNSIRYLKADFPEGMETIGRDYVTLNDICFKPLAPDNTNCTIMTVLNYWQNNPVQLNKTAPYEDTDSDFTTTVDYHDHFLYCVQAPSSVQDLTVLQQDCLGDYGGPVMPYVALGGFTGKDYNAANALLLSFVVNNYPRDSLEFRMALAWEKKFLEIIQNWNNTDYTYAYFSERSIEDEIVRSSQADLIIFAGSYVAIFLYITLALGTYTSFSRVPVDAKVTLGLVGIFVVLGSVFASIGFYGYIGIATSLIVIEVVPFLVLAIGADNVFILTLEFQRERNRDEKLEVQIGRVLGEVGPSMLLCSLTEAVAFFLGLLSDMPAVDQFAMCAALAIVFDFLLQITVFVAVLTLDAKRQESDRADILCCVKVKGESKSPQRLQNIFQNYFTPALMHDLVRGIVILGFFALFCWCIYLTSNITVGLDQDLSVPLDSYVLNYFDYMEKYLLVGVPVYFVTKGPFNFSNPESGNLVCGSAGCDVYSMLQQISFAAENPDYWQIATPANSWYDDYKAWLQPLWQKSCCKYEVNSDPKEFCPANPTVNSTDARCIPCLNLIDYTPTPDEFMEYLPWFLKDNPGVACSKGGHAAYGAAVSLENNADDVMVIPGSYFSAYHTVCIKSSECTENLRMARELSENITATLRRAEDVPDDFEVFPYTIYYVYYEQYLTMIEDTALQLGVCLIPTFIFNFILLGFDAYSGLISIFTIFMIVVDTAGLCSLWGVDLNAVSLINLVTAIGLSVEFTSHVIRAFSLSTKKGRKRRVIDAMSTMGPAVFAGVALTNLPGIIVLAFAKAQLIQIFFFRMCLVITLLGMAHGLLFLPVFLSIFGPPVNKAILYEKQQKVKEMIEPEGKGINMGYVPGDDEIIKAPDAYEFDVNDGEDVKESHSTKF